MDESHNSNRESSHSQEELIALTKRNGREYKKTATTRARVLSEKDFKERKGVIQTKEGPAKFEVGDYLAVGIDGEEWPISKETMEKTKKIIGRKTIAGHSWGIFENINTVLGLQINVPFKVTLASGSVISGKAGDYFVYDGSGCWITDKSIFERTYVVLKK